MDMVTLLILVLQGVGTGLVVWGFAKLAFNQKRKSDDSIQSQKPDELAELKELERKLKRM